MLTKHFGRLTFDGVFTPIVHCVSADFALGAGFANQVPQKHKESLRLLSRKFGTPSVGDVYTTEFDGVKIHHLVTKEECTGKPTLLTFEAAVGELERVLPQGAVVFCPKLGCGLDRLPWKIVSRRLDLSTLHFIVCLTEDVDAY